MHTEAEAKKLWCPWARTVWQFRESDGDAIVVANRAENDVPMTWCIASQCSQWRWGGIGCQACGNPEPGWVSPGVMCERLDCPGPNSTEQYGYCGLAGKPEA